MNRSSEDNSDQSAYDAKECKFNLTNNLPLNDDDLQKLIFLRKYEQIQWFVEVISLTEGQSFGDLIPLSNKDEQK